MQKNSQESLDFYKKNTGFSYNLSDVQIVRETWNLTRVSLTNEVIENRKKTKQKPEFCFDLKPGFLINPGNIENAILEDFINGLGLFPMKIEEFR